jgi:DNA polymerase elongation subunit (family B)
MANFYTNVQSVGNNILFRGYAKGKKVKGKIEYRPRFFELSNKVTNYTNLQGEYLQEIKFDSMREAREYFRQFENVSGKKIYGNSRFEYAYIADHYKGMIEWDFNKVDIAVIDIEVGSENGFPDPYQANEPITAIAWKDLNGHMSVWGCGDFTNNDTENVTYYKCKDEWTLCTSFLNAWALKTPDVVTGWNTEFFDIPYLVNRFRKILGEDYVKKMSPWNLVSERKVFVMNKQQIVYDIVGVGHLDYLELYKWYSPNGKSQESYKLDSIANVELGERKLSYDEYDSLHQLYKLNFQKFIEYNIKDVQLIIRLEDKLKLLELALTLAYDTKCNYTDVFAQTRMWDALTYNNLLEKNIIVPPRVVQEKDSAFEGAYVKEPQVGKHDWVASFDLDSLYPHLMMQYNVSPETLIEPENYTPEMREILSQGVSVDALLMKRLDTSRLVNATLTPNGQFFRTDFQGFLPKMMEEMYEDRKKFKKLMLQAKQEYENEKDESKKYEIEKKIAKYNNLQLAKKVSLNSAYGALGSQYFRFYDLRMALAVTLAGQLSIRWIENKLNEYMNNLLKTKSDYVIASDTDSIYLRLNELVQKVYGTQDDVSLSGQKIIEFMDRVCQQKIQPFIDKSYAELAEYVHAYAQKMRMKREALADKGIWTAKKRYIMHVYNNEGVQYNEPQMKVMGLEMIKSSTPAPVREKMKHALELMMKGQESDIHSFIDKFRKEFKSLPPEEISFPRGINGLSQYSNKTTIYSKGTPIHVKGALLYNNYLEEKGLTKKYPLIQEGEKIKFAYLKKPNPFKDSVISFPGRLPPEFNLNPYIDYDMQFEKTFLDPIKVVLDCMNWSTEKTVSLFD